MRESGVVEVIRTEDSGADDPKDDARITENSRRLTQIIRHAKTEPHHSATTKAPTSSTFRFQAEALSKSGHSS